MVLAGAALLAGGGGAPQLAAVLDSEHLNIININTGQDTEAVTCNV